MSKFHIRIENLETGEAFIDKDTDCIVGAVNLGDKTRVLGLTHCNALALAETVSSADDAVRELKEEHPIIEVLLGGHALMKSDDQTSPDDEPENN